VERLIQRCKPSRSLALRYDERADRYRALRALDVIGMGFDNLYPISLGLPISIAWAVLGVIFSVYLRARTPETLVNLATEMARVREVGEEEEAGGRAVRT